MVRGSKQGPIGSNVCRRHVTGFPLTFSCAIICQIEIRKSLFFTFIHRFDAYKSLLYLTGHVASNYAALHRIFSEVIFTFVTLDISIYSQQVCCSLSRTRVLKPRPKLKVKCIMEVPAMNIMKPHSNVHIDRTSGS